MGTKIENSIKYLTAMRKTYQADSEMLSTAIDTMRKYQKIEQIIKDHDNDKIPEDYWYIDKIRKVIGYGNNNQYN